MFCPTVLKMSNNTRLMKINESIQQPKVIIEKIINDIGKWWKYNIKWEKEYRIIIMEIISIC